jgi:4-alpha-glucanotransferase
VKRRRSGLLLPLFSMVSSESWGIGEYRDIVAVTRWMRAAGQSFIQILPITELPESETSPYSALTAMAIDPIYISLPAVEDFAALGGEGRLSTADRDALARVRSATRVAYKEVRALKNRWLRKAFQQFARHELSTGSRRAKTFAEFVQAHAAWLDDYALYRALRDRFSQQAWWNWPKPLATRQPGPLATASQELRDEINYRKYLQWVAAEQWAGARRDAAPVQIFGDVPFMISADSPDVWTRQDEFRLDATVGAPPDAFSETGQDWGLPPWRWEVMAQNDFDWMRTRANRTAELFDGFRLDHLVGLYRTYLRPLDPSVEPFFAPDDEPTQAALGERLVSLYSATGAEVIAEDLGTVPDFVRESLRRLEVPGFKVMRWERQWDEPDEPYLDPTDYDEISVATTGTHDTEPLVTWWASLNDDERSDVRAIPSVRRHLPDSASELDAVLRALLDAQSYVTIIPFQDFFALPDRINTPNEVSEDNWSWVLPWHVDRLLATAQSRDRARTLAAWTREAHR